jgi:hypothetical protein
MRTGMYANGRLRFGHEQEFFRKLKNYVFAAIEKDVNSQRLSRVSSA